MDVTKFDDNGKKRVAVAYLVAHPEDCPETAKKAMTKLKQYEAEVSNIAQTIKQSQQAIDELVVSMKEALAGTGALVDLIGDEIPADKVIEFCDKYVMPEAVQKQINQEMAARAADTQVETPATPAPEADMAGSSAKNLPPPVLPR